MKNESNPVTMKTYQAILLQLIAEDDAKLLLADSTYTRKHNGIEYEMVRTELAIEASKLYAEQFTPLTKSVSITDEEIGEEAEDFELKEGYSDFEIGAIWARDEMLSRNVISIQRDKAIAVAWSTGMNNNLTEKQCIDIVDRLIESGYLSSHLIEGEQRKPLEFEEYVDKYYQLKRICPV